ncbi:hypothetical protein EDD11_009022 [Mortierella claussenii]|nr:hypothetical protein EDD11_009022 [Mortierella claussenii]
MKAVIPVLALLLTSAVNADTDVYPDSPTCSGGRVNTCPIHTCCLFWDTKSQSNLWLLSAEASEGSVLGYQYTNCVDIIKNTESCANGGRFGAAQSHQETSGCEHRPYICKRKRSMALQRNLLKDVLGFETEPGSVGWKDGKSGTEYHFLSDTQEAEIFGEQSTPQERETFAKANHTFSLDYDQKILKRVEKGPTWGKTHPRKPYTGTPTINTDGPTVALESFHTSTDSHTIAPESSTTDPTN